MTAKKSGSLFLGLLIIVVIAVSMFMIFSLVEKIVNRMNEGPQPPGYADSGDSGKFFDGQQYTLNSSLETILVLGLDSPEASLGAEDEPTQADFVALIILDRHHEAYRILHINRDTMTDIQRTTAIGEGADTFTAQLALAHSYGETENLRCQNTVDAVENLLYNSISIDHYFSVTMDAIPIIADAVGGVTVTLENDFPVLGEGFVKGTAVTLTGEDALTFVRYRNNDATGSNVERMERQRLFIAALVEQYVQKQTDVESTLNTLEKISSHFHSDCTASRISNLLECFLTYENAGMQALPGEAKLGDEYVEFYVDEEALQRLIIECFYTPVHVSQ